MEMAMIEIGVSDVKCIGFNSLMELPLGRYGIYDPKTERVIDEAAIDELWAGISVNEDWIMKAGYVHKLLTAAGLGKGETK
jgi:hypothetical protein